MKRIFFTLLVLGCLSAPGIVKAENKNFDLNSKFIYELTATGKFNVRQEVKIKNLTTEHYVPSLSFSTAGFSPDGVSAFENGNTATVKGQDSVYTVTLPRPAVGKGANATVVFTFSDNTIATKRGDVWEIRIPRLTNHEDFTSSSVVLRLPKDFAKKLHIYPTPISSTEKSSYFEYVFDTVAVKGHSIVAYIGDIAQYQFKLTYPLNNTFYLSKDVEFALPPDTAYQKVQLTSIPEDAQTIKLDSDGNWVASVRLKPHEQRNIEVEGFITVFASPRADFPIPSHDVLTLNKTPQKFWESDSPEIKELARSLETPREIYEYVVRTLSYDYSKTSRAVERLGASAALKTPSEALCMEFTDLFIAIARAASIPAREMNGYAVTDDATHPRSLAGDILHSWPEYWDSTKQQWIPVDPTWGKTTGGVDYFSQMDLNHVVFAIHGLSSNSPLAAGTYESTEAIKLVEVTPQTTIPEESGQVTVAAKQNIFSPFSLSYTLSLTSTKNVAQYGTDIHVFSEKSEIYTERIAEIPPFTTLEKEIKLPFGFLGKDLPKRLTIKTQFGEQIVQVPALTMQIMSLLMIVALPALIGGLAFVLYIRRK